MIFKLPNITLVVFLSFFLAGCLELETKIRIMPDGSGNCTMTIGQNVEGIAQVMKGMFGDSAMMGEGEDGSTSTTVSHTGIKLKEIRERYKGIVAFSAPEEWKENGWKYVRYTAWFDDINEVRLYEKEKTGRDAPEVAVQFSWKPQADGHVLEIQGSTLFGVEVTNGMGGPVVGDPLGENSPDIEMPKEIQDMLARLLGDASFAERFDLPGPVRNADAPFVPEGRTASFTLSGKDVFDKEEKTIWAEKDHFRIAVGPTQISADEVAVFAQELREAKTSWKKKQDEFEAKVQAERVQTAVVRKERNEVISSGKTIWTVDLQGVSIPDRTASGVIHNQEFVVEKATFQNGVLELRQGSDFFPDHAVAIFLFLDDGQGPDGQSFSIDAGSDGFSQPHVHMKYKVEGRMLPKTEMFTGKYSMQLKLGQSENGLLPGQIYLCLPDKGKSVVAGMFEAEIMGSQKVIMVDSHKKPEKIRKAEKVSDAVPELLVPLGGAVMDNATVGRKNNLLWEFDWADMPDARMYKIQVWREGSESQVVDSVVKDSHYRHLTWDVISKGHLKGWYWKVQAWIGKTWGSWSEVRSFYVETAGIDPRGLEKPTFTGSRKTTVTRKRPLKAGVPRLLVPRAGAVLANGGKGVKGKPVWKFSWLPVAGATKYHLHVNGPRAKFPVINRSDLEQPQFIHFMKGHIVNSNRNSWRWKVRAFINGEWKDWSSPRRFNVKSLK